jgi:hypothetical protein
MLAALKQRLVRQLHTTSATTTADKRVCMELAQADAAARRVP